MHQRYHVSKLRRVSGFLSNQTPYCPITELFAILHLVPRTKYRPWLGCSQRLRDAIAGPVQLATPIALAYERPCLRLELGQLFLEPLARPQKEDLLDVPKQTAKFCTPLPNLFVGVTIYGLSWLSLSSLYVSPRCSGVQFYRRCQRDAWQCAAVSLFLWALDTKRAAQLRLDFRVS